MEAMEEEAEALMVGRATAAAERNEADGEDDQAVAGAAVSAALAALSRGGSLPGEEPTSSNKSWKRCQGCVLLAALLRVAPFSCGSALTFSVCKRNTSLLMLFVEDGVSAVCETLNPQVYCYAQHVKVRSDQSRVKGYPSASGCCPCAAGATAAAEAAAAEAEAAAAGGGMGVQLDELGRDVNMERRRTAAVRAQRRQARLQRDLERLRQRPVRRSAPLPTRTRPAVYFANAAKCAYEGFARAWHRLATRMRSRQVFRVQRLLGSKVLHEKPPEPLKAQGGAEAPLGEETSSESEGEASRYVRKRRDLVDAARTVFADAGDEFGSLRALKARPAHRLTLTLVIIEAVTWSLQVASPERSCLFACNARACLRQVRHACPSYSTHAAHTGLGWLTRECKK